MRDRTLKIIAICKGGTKYNTGDNLVECVKSYLADECHCPIKDFSYNFIETIIKEAMYDYIDHCDKPSDFLRNVERVYAGDCMPIVLRICIAFKLQFGTHFDKDEHYRITEKYIKSKPISLDNESTNVFNVLKEGVAI